MKTKLLTICLLIFLSGCSEAPISGKFLNGSEHVCEDEFGLHFIDENIKKNNKVYTIKSAVIIKDYVNKNIWHNNLNKVPKNEYESKIVPKSKSFKLRYNKSVLVAEYELNCSAQEFMYKKMQHYFPKPNKYLISSSSCRIGTPGGSNKDFIDFKKSTKYSEIYGPDKSYINKKDKFANISEISCRAKIFDYVCFTKELTNSNFQKVSNEEKIENNKNLKYWNRLREKECENSQKGRIRLHDI